MTSPEISQKMPRHIRWGLLSFFVITMAFIQILFPISGFLTLIVIAFLLENFYFLAHSLVEAERDDKKKLGIFTAGLDKCVISYIGV